MNGFNVRRNQAWQTVHCASQKVSAMGAAVGPWPLRRSLGGLHISPMQLDWPITLCGCLVGCLVGMSGMRDGAVMTGLLIVLFGLHPLTAVGIDLIFLPA
jgi:hypothetical protein